MASKAATQRSSAVSQSHVFSKQSDTCHFILKNKLPDCHVFGCAPSRKLSVNHLCAETPDKVDMYFYDSEPTISNGTHFVPKPEMEQVQSAKTRDDRRDRSRNAKAISDFPKDKSLAASAIFRKSEILTPEHAFVQYQTRSDDQTCQVCGQPAVGFHHRAYVCEACKGSILYMKN